MLYRLIIDVWAKVRLAAFSFSSIILLKYNTTFQVALGGREKPSFSRHPRALANDIYFDNQGAATSTF